jgi:decaprenylphospho-beta-D-erythro-pentofuranosid-2-ulose 2-reductase
MMDSLGRYQTALLLGGASDIGLAIARRLVVPRGRLVLGGRDTARLKEHVDSTDHEVHCIHYDATDPASETTRALSEAAMFVGDLDVIIVCAGILVDECTIDAEPAALEIALRTNMVGPAVAVRAALAHLRAQGHGTLIVLSSTAAIHTRKALLAYGLAKASLDRYCLGLADLAHANGIRLLVVRPGHVRTRMTRGLPEPAFTTTPDAVAARVATALRARRSVVYAPAVLAAVFATLRLLPNRLVDRIYDSASKVSGGQPGQTP